MKCIEIEAVKKLVIKHIEQTVFASCPRSLWLDSQGNIMLHFFTFLEMDCGFSRYKRSLQDHLLAQGYLVEISGFTNELLYLESLGTDMLGVPTIGNSKYPNINLPLDTTIKQINKIADIFIETNQLKLPQTNLQQLLKNVEVSEVVSYRKDSKINNNDTHSKITLYLENKRNMQLLNFLKTKQDPFLMFRELFNNIQIHGISGSEELFYNVLLHCTLDEYTNLCNSLLSDFYVALEVEIVKASRIERPIFLEVEFKFKKVGSLNKDLYNFLYEQAV